MYLYNLRLPLLILTAISCCCGNTLLPPKISGVKGKNVKFTLTIPSTFQPSTISWAYLAASGEPSQMFAFGNQQETIPEAYNGRIAYNQTTYTLELKSLTAADSGVYTVIILNSKFLSIPGQTTLEVLDPVADVVIISSQPEAVEFNSTVILTCSAKGSFLSYKWLNGSAPVVIDGKHFVANGSQLVITEVLRMDLRGPIYCVAENKLESMTSTGFNMTVNYGPENIAMTKVPDTTVLKKGSNLTLNCSVVSSPAADLKWLFNGAVLRPGSTITLTNLEENQSGNYSCVAYNSKTMRYVFSQVATVSIIEAISGTNIIGPTSPLIAGNSTTNLTCTSTVGKADSVSWLKDGKPLDASNRITFTTDKRALSIIPVQKEDTGEYTCQLTNKVNTNSSSYKIEISYGPEKAAIEGPKKAEVLNAVVMKCLVASFPPATYIWKLNDTLLEITTSEYKIEKPDYKSSGIYTCEAYNNVTNLRQTATHNLLVKGAGELNDQLSDGAVAGIVIAVLLLLAIIIGVIIHKRRKPGDVPSPY